jgi:hypothetical protein
MEINIGKLNIVITASIHIERYYLIWSDLINAVVGSTTDESMGRETNHRLIEVSKKEWLKHRSD